MSVRNLSAGGLGLIGVGGPLLLWGLVGRDLGVPLVAGVAALWLGLLLVVAAVLQLGRIEHRMLRTQGEVIRRLGSSPTDGGGDAVSTQVLERLATVEATVTGAMDRQRRELLQTVDARILGIHEAVRDLATRVDDADRGTDG